MKILITTDLYTTSTNGVVTSLRNLMEELQKLGHEVRVLTVSDQFKSYREGNISFIQSLPLGAVYPDVRMPVSYRHRYIKDLIAWKPDVIHSQCEFFSYQFARYVSKKTGAPIVHTYHTLYEQYAAYVIPGKRLGNYCVRVFSKHRLKKAAAIVAPTEKVEGVLKSYGIANPIHVIPSGIALQQHRSRISTEERAQKRAELGIPEENLVLLNLGRLGTEKNLPEVLRFFAQACGRGNPLTLLIVGDGPARKELQAMAKELGIADKVIFTGMVNPGEVHKYYQLGDVFVSASTSETQGLTYVEAAANGLPLLCRRDPCLNGVLAEGSNGYTYETESEFAGLLDKILQDRQWCAAAGARSAEIAETFDKGHFAKRIEELYQSVLG